MKRIVFLLAFLISLSVADAQSPVYLVFTSTKSQAVMNGVWHTVKMSNYTQAGWKNPPHTISLFYNNHDLCLTFVSKDIAPIKKPKDFLNSVTYIDWDIIGPALSKSQAEAKYNEIARGRIVYCIDRNEIKNNQLQLIPITKYKSKF